MTDLSIIAVLVRLLLGVIIGFTIGLTGVGGGVLVLPALTVLLGMPASLSVGTASLYASITQAMASFRHYRLKNINFHAAFLVLLGALPANIFTALMLNRLSRQLQDSPADLAAYEHYRQIFIGAVITFAALMLISNFVRKEVKRRKNTGTDITSKEIQHFSSLTVLRGLLVGAIVGFLIASTSVGGGVITIPLLIIAFKVGTNKAVGTSSMITLLLTAATALIYGKGGMLDTTTAVVMAVGSVTGVYWGSKLAAKMPEKTLQIIIIVIILVAAAAMVL